jgi:hypothetical protein
MQLLLAFFKGLIVPPQPGFQLSKLLLQLSHFKDKLFSIFAIVAHQNLAPLRSAIGMLEQWNDGIMWLLNVDGHKKRHISNEL